MSESGDARSWLRARLGTLPETVRYGRVPTERDYPTSIAWDDAGNAIIADTLRAGRPCLVTRLGLSELQCVAFYRRWRHAPACFTYPAYTRHLMHMNAGFFPDDDASLDRFSALFLDAASEADVMAVWFNRGEDATVQAACPGARLVELSALNSMCYPSPWSAELAGKTVLVVHPFAETILRQYGDHRRDLFKDPLVLPEFELKTLMPVQSIAGTPCGFPDWFAALDDTCERVGRERFDIAVIGAGAYGLPIGAYVKRLGRQAVHMGGATQLLFGIKGRRWEVEYADTIAPLFNDHWTRPSSAERPVGAGDVETGCYW